jgi:NAD(P)H-hydrate epimerase
VIRGVGIDLVDVDRFRKSLERRPALIERLFTASEQEYARRHADPAERFAVRFAAKEATLKSMGVGIGAVGWHDIEVVRAADGRPSVQISGRATELARQLGIVRFEVSLTHTGALAQAEVLAIGGRGQHRIAEWRSGADQTSSVMETATIISGGLVPIVAPVEMNAIDHDAPEPVAELIARAGAALARHALRMLGGTYGRRVVVLVGRGNNGNDGRDAARRLLSRGVRVRVIEVGQMPEVLPDCDLVIDAAFGSGYRIDADRRYTAPSVPPGAAVLAVDIPSGIDGLTGAAGGGSDEISGGGSISGVLRADETLTFAALKPGLLFGEGARCAGSITVADIGLDVSRASAHLVGAASVAGWLHRRDVDAHKWNSAVCIVAGGQGMEGAAALASRAALRAGAGYVRLASPGRAESMNLPVEVVRSSLPVSGWADSVLADLERFRSLVIGNGLGLAPETSSSILDVLAGARRIGLPTVVDADALTALATLTNSGEGRSSVASVVGASMVLTPHDGEFARLDGSSPGPDRIDAARRLARSTGAVVLLKGASTVVASPAGDVLVSTSGDARLATAGTGDVLAGIIGALLAEGLDVFRAAAAGAFIHGRAGALGWMHGSVAGDLPWRIPAVRAELDRLLP